MLKKIVLFSSLLFIVNLANANCADDLDNSMDKIDAEYKRDRHRCSGAIFSVLEQSMCLREAELSWDQKTEGAIDAYVNC